MERLKQLGNSVKVNLTRNDEEEDDVLVEVTLEENLYI